MKCSEESLQLMALCECSMIKSTAQFWSAFADRERIGAAVEEYAEVGNKLEFLREKVECAEGTECGISCVFDEDFPPLNVASKRSDMPFLLFYRGDLSLLSQTEQNIAVIGETDPTPEIERREREIVRILSENGITVVSGLANGCDAIAHSVCVEQRAKTIAVLPSTLQKIYPAANRRLADEIVANGGLLVTEYYREPMSRNDALGRYIERDRLQALFSKAVIMIASYRAGQGDSGSRFAMGHAEALRLPRFAMFHEATDASDIRFGLNRDMIAQNKAETLTLSSLRAAIAACPPKTEKFAEKPRQIKFF